MRVFPRFLVRCWGGPGPLGWSAVVTSCKERSTCMQLVAMEIGFIGGDDAAAVAWSGYQFSCTVVVWCGHVHRCICVVLCGVGTWWDGRGMK